MLVDIPYMEHCGFCGDDDSHQYRCELRILCALIFIGWLTWPGVWWFLDTHAVLTTPVRIQCESSINSQARQRQKPPILSPVVWSNAQPPPLYMAISPTWEITKKNMVWCPTSISRLLNRQDFIFFLWCHHFFHPTHWSSVKNTSG